MKKGFVFILLLLALLLSSGCIQPPVCGNGACETGENQQNCPQDCGTSPTHFECQNQKCAIVQGAGVDKCQTDKQCLTIPEKHNECNEQQQCIEISGSGPNECQSSTECKLPKSGNINFVKIHEGTYTGTKINLYFVNFGYPSDNYASFVYDVNYALFADDSFEGKRQRGLLNAEPFKTYKERFDIYQLKKILDGEEIGCGDSCNMMDVTVFIESADGLNLGKCSNDYSLIDDKYSLVNCNEFVLLIKTLPSGWQVTADNEYMPIQTGIESRLEIFLHEMGHLFGGIRDEYDEGYNQVLQQTGEYDNLNSLSVSLEGQNCDVRPGCPSWCSGPAKKVQITGACTYSTTESACNSNYADSCVWITNPELVDYFGSNCIPQWPSGDVLSWNSGNQCGEELGCYYGCDGFGWRPTKISLYGPNLYMWDSVEWNNYTKDGLEPFNSIQKKMINEKIEKNTNYVSGNDIPISTEVARTRMVWDLPELTGFIPGGMWNLSKSETQTIYHIDLRYIKVDQRSEFALDIIEDPASMIVTALPDSFLDEKVSEARGIWKDISLKEINGNKIFEGTTDASAGKQKYALWISEDNFVRGWNGNDEGTVIDDALFDALLNAYLKKYPSTYGRG
ncbi:MAG: hypothetical protein WC634_00805 [archaeon]